MTQLERNWLDDYPVEILQALALTARQHGIAMFVSGGAVRDWLQNRASQDLDITVNRDPFEVAGFVARTLGGAFVPLDAEQGVARVVWKRRHVIDFSVFRDNTRTIEADLSMRDFTINALAVALDCSADKAALQRPYTIIDPTGGVADFRDKLIRPTSDAVFENDPLRFLRAYRFQASLGFAFEKSLQEQVAHQARLLERAAPERIVHELELIMQSSRAAACFRNMAESTLLWVIFPELMEGKGMKQPASHHLDVFEHNLAALEWMEALQRRPERYYPGHGPAMSRYLASGKRAVWLKWAALFHDLGKPEAFALREERITFYSHERAGARRFAEIGQRLRLSKEDVQEVARFIDLHMWPFHLNNARVKTGITARACLRLVKAVGDELPGLFLLAMADSLAGQGPDKPPSMEESLADLYAQVDRVYQESIKPVLESPPLLNGHDLQALFGLAPSPLFKTILEGLQKDQVAGEVTNRDGAIAWVTTFLETEGK